jgi:REP element-mobilizing transposase RayT
VPFPQAYFLTWTTYGTRLHGDPRGTVDKAHNLYGHPRLPTNNPRRILAQSKLEADPVILTPAKRHAVRAAILEHATFKQWPIHALNVRTNHVHVVCSAKEPPEKVMNAFKAYGTRRLRTDKLAAADSKVWTHHGSTRYLWDGVGLHEAVYYVTRLQD